ncbi:MAG: LysM peptidoglycan-binding domain-containing protein [Cyanobacteria bacterium REEB417]|nr:LysM peptidoglycan-binding domain-containing protein [Cyanobacteria bacterium REEB417]
MRRSLAALALAVVLPAGVVLPSASRADVVVKPGETLSEIAERNGVSLTRLMQANGISDPAFVEAGRRLVIPGTRSTAAAARPAPAAGGSTTVKPGETLSEIADRHGTTVERLMQLNGISNPNLVAAGTRLTLPGQPRRSVAQSANSRHHVVQSGETLSHIADAYDMPVERLIALNRISDPNLVVAGTRLEIKAPPPVAKPRPVAQKPRPAAGPVAAKPAAKPTPKAVAVASQQPADRPVASKQVVNKQVVSKPEGVKPSDAQPALAAAAASATTSSQTVAARPVDSTAAEAKKTEPKSTEPTAAKSSAAESRPVDTRAADTRPADQKPLAAKPVSSRPIAAAMATSQPAARTSPAASSKPVSSKPAAGKAGPDWRTYGPMQIDWANWRSMGGSLVAPSLGSDGKPHYLAVNCGARKINATSQSGQWKTWDNPQSDEEQRLVSDLCTSRGG